MASLVHHTRQSSLHKMLFMSQKRFNIRESIHRHTEPSKFKKHMLAACEPYERKKYLTPEERCKGVNIAEHPLLPLEQIIVKELLDVISKSDFILFLQHNYAQFQSERVYKNTIIKTGCKFHALNNNIYKETFRILKRDELLGLFITRNSLVTGSVDSLPSCVTALKKMPQFILLAGLVDNYVCNVKDLNAIAVSNNIDVCRANLLATLETPAIDLLSNLQQHCEAIKPANEDK